jgi:hypothetical protein
LEVYVDGCFISSMPFRSSTKTLGGFAFGPVSGYDLQFIIIGNTIYPMTLHFPIRIR